MVRKKKWKPDFWIRIKDDVLSLWRHSSRGEEFEEFKEWLTTIKDRDPGFATVNFPVEVENEVDGKREMPSFL